MNDVMQWPAIQFFVEVNNLLQLRKHWVHLLIWAVMLIYLVTAPTLYVRFILRDGKPVSLAQELPISTEQIKYSADRLDPDILNGQNLYRLWGWAFISGEVDQSPYERFIVLRSDTRTYIFSSKVSPRPDVQSVFADLKIDLSNSGFTTYIAKEVIPIGTYRIGILLRHKSSSSIYFVETNKKIIRNANQLVLSQ